MSQEEKIDDLIEMVTFIKDNAVSKEDFDVLHNDVSILINDVSGLKHDVSGLKHEVIEIRQEAKTTKEELIRHIDGMVTQHTRLDHEYVAMKAKVDRHEDRIEILEKHADLPATS